NSLRTYDFKGKRVLLRVDFNVPMENGLVTDDKRIVASLPTIRYLLDQGASIVIMSHLGRPMGEYNVEFSLKPVAEKLSELLGKPVKFLGAPCVYSKEVEKEAKALLPGEIAMIENTRFRKEEEVNDPKFAKDLATLGEVYVNDAFGTSHRSHASNVGVSELLPSCLGLLLEKEVEVMGKILANPPRPFVAILGGAKVSDKLGVIRNLINKVDKIVIVGAMAFTFLKGQGYNVGKSLVENDLIDLSKELLEEAKKKGVKIILPIDIVETEEIVEGGEYKTVDIDSMDSNLMGVDIGEKTLHLIEGELSDALTVLWNGPAGVFEIPEYSKGTFGIAKAVADMDGIKVIGGGDSALAIEKSGLSDKMTHISTGGGASLELLEGKVLPGISAIVGVEN
ncbi:MAG: phosphoglycerate kinase, partial [Gallicola sp.]|nr:phosphoglycerate kinase [Gallicola sp.]